jgi:hypothetical protein
MCADSEAQAEPTGESATVEGGVTPRDSGAPTPEPEPASPTPPRP